MEPETAMAGLQKQGSFGKAPSAAPSGSRGGKSKGSRGSGSKGGSKSSASRRKKQAGRVKRRVKRNITFSEWEADTYIPQVKLSWGLVLKNSSPNEVGAKLYQTFVGGATDLQHMFTSPSDVLSGKFAEILDSIVSSTDNPAALHEQLKSLAPMHIKKGVKAEYLPRFGEALLKTLVDCIGPAFTTEMRAAWEWLWAWLTQSFIMSLEEASTEATILSQSWDMAMDNCPGTEFGELFYEVLFELAPNMSALFNKPKQILSVKFMEMISTLVSFNNDPQRLKQQSIWLGMRHVKYGSRPQHTQVLGQVMISTLERAVGEEWTAEMDKAWSDLWTISCKSMLDVTIDAEKYGEIVRQMWADTQQRTTCQKFGSSLRKMLLSGTEWVQGLSQVEQHKEEANGKKGDTPNKAKDDKKKFVAAVAKKMAGDDANGDAKSQTSNSQKHASGTDTPTGMIPGKDQNGTFNDKSSDADAVGSHFWEMLTQLCDLLWEPEQMNEKLIVTTKRFYELGIRQAHLTTIGTAIGTSIHRVLDTSWKPIMKEAWDWFWAMISDAMGNALEVMESGDVELIRSGWEEAKASRPAEELGEIFFKELARIAPHVTHLFKRPKRIQALQFINVVEMLLCFNEDPESFFVDLKPLTIRHIKYGVKADYARAFGLTVLNGIKEVLGDKLDEKAKTAWTKLWTRVSSCVTRALNVGSNLVIVSLVQDDLDNFIDAMDCVPRGERFATLTHVDVNGEVVSPLDWSVMGGQVNIARWVIDDLLTIRADRDTYYYGRETMYMSHPDLVAKLCRQMPNLIENMLDGLMWHASMVVDGKVRVNYYVREMYGVPDETLDAWGSTLGELVQHGAPELFNHPVTEILLDIKWKRFALRLYLSIQIWYTIMLGLFTAGFAQMADSCQDQAKGLRIASGAMAIVTFLVQMVVILRQVHHQQTLGANFAGWTIQIPRFLVNPWNASRLLSSAMLIVVAMSETCIFLTGAPYPDWYMEGYEGERRAIAEDYHNLGWHTILVAFTAILLWLQFLQVLVLSDKIAAFIYAVGRMTTDIVLNFTVITVIIVAFGTCMNILRQPGGYNEDIGSSMLNVLRVLIGIGTPESQELESWGLFALISCIILVVVCLFNILVAQLVSSYSILAQNAEGFAKMNRAYLCVEMESFLPMGARRTYYDEFHFDDPLEFDTSDEGPQGGIQVILSSSVRTHPKYVPDRVKRFTGEASPMDPWPTNKPEELDEPGVLESDAPAVD